MRTALCPSCNSDVVIEDGYSQGDLVNCPNCGQELEIISLQPLQVKKLVTESEENELPRRKRTGYLSD